MSYLPSFMNQFALHKDFGWRLFSETEKLAIFYFWQTVGTQMGIQNLTITYEEFAQFNINNEQQHFVYADNNRRVGESTVNLFLGWFPAIVRPVLKPVVQGMFDPGRDRVRQGFPQPNPMTRNLVTFILTANYAAILMVTNLRGLGPIKMLDGLNKSIKK